MQDVLAGQGGGHDSGTVESLFALGLAHGCAEIAERGDGDAVHLHNFGRVGVGFRHSQPDKA